MAAHFTPTYRPRPAGPGLSGLFLVLLFGGLLREAAIPLSGLPCALAAELLRTLPSLLLAALHAHQAHAPDFAPHFACFQTLASYAPVLHGIFGAK
jgi:hypothetical protein